MSNVIKVAKARYRDLKTWRHRARLRRELLGWNDQLLTDLGFSRPLLEQGVHAWPWREAVETIQPGDGLDSTTTAVDSDWSIEQAVYHGRPGNDDYNRFVA